MPIYRDPVITWMIGLFNATGPSVLKNKYFYGDPLQVNKSQLPACFITKDDTRTGASANAEDESVMNYVINVVLDLTRDFGQSFDNVQSSNTLYEILEGRGSDFKLLPSSMTYILRANQDVGSGVTINLKEPLQTDYGIGIEKRGPGMFTVEGVLRVQVIAQQLRPGL